MNSSRVHDGDSGTKEITWTVVVFVASRGSFRILFFLSDLIPTAYTDLRVSLLAVDTLLLLPASGSMRSSLTLLT